MQTPDLTDKNIEQIAALFPNAITETKDESGKLKKAVDFDLLKQALSKNLVEADEERYRLDWPGKKASLLKANTPINKTLRPCREESVNFDTTENLYIEGDNFEVLKILQESYLGEVKMIYIDPPYNTGSDFIYKDNFKKSKEEYEEELGVEDEEGGKLFRNTDSNGRFHSDWLNMMYERLVVARDLLKDDGVIVIHIDENEYPNLEKILSEIFGEENNLGTIVWDKRNPKGEVVGVAQQHELISFYCKNKDRFKDSSELKRPKDNADRILNKAQQLIKRAGCVNGLVREEFKKWLSNQDFSGGEKAYKFIDDYGEVYRPVSMAAPDKPETRSHRPLIHPITNKPCPVPAKGWRFPDVSMGKLLKNNEILFGIDDSTQPNRKYLLKENLYENVPSLLYFGGSDDALSLPFDNPKPVIVSRKLIESVCKIGDIVLDFFSGSATTAHAVMQLNADASISSATGEFGNRKFIMVQLPEKTDENSEAYKAGYKTISDIGKERIRRAGEKILSELKTKTRQLKLVEEPADTSKLDIGFRVYKTDSSNMADVFYHPNELKQRQLSFFESNIKEDRTPEDLLTQVILDLGLELSLPIETKKMLGNTVFIVQTNALVACFDNDIDFKIVDTIADLKPFKVVFKDAGFVDDKDRINVEARFKRLSPETKVTVI